MNGLCWRDDGLYAQQVCVFPHTPQQLRAWLDSDYRAAVQAITAVPACYRTAIAVGVAATYPPTDACAAYLILLLRWSAAWASCAECGGRPVTKENIGGAALWRCAGCKRAARAAEQRDIQVAVARGNTWLLAKQSKVEPEPEAEPEQVSMFEMLEAA